MGGERDFRNDFSIPFKFTPKNILDFAPVWALDMLFCGVPSLDAFPGVVDAAGSRVTVMVDGGNHRWRDIVRALALGAKSVLIGRATLYGACAAGEAGAYRTIEILREELVRAAPSGSSSLS